MPRRKPAPVTFDTVREVALALPGVEEGTSYGTPALKVRGKLLARLREDGESFVLPIDFADRDFLLGAEPDTFFITDHYAGYPMVLVRLSSVRRGEVGKLLERAWRPLASKKLLAALEGAPKRR